MTFLPPSSDTGAMALLSMVSDPEAYRAKLEEITKANADLNKSIEESRTLHREIANIKLEIKQRQAQLEESEKLLRDQIEGTKAELEVERKNLQDQLAKAHNDTVTAAAKLSKAAELETKLNAQQTDLSLRERVISGREEALAVKEQFVQQKLEEHTDRVRRLQEIIS